MIYIQTDPPEKTAMTKGSSVAVLGWTEPGTRIVVNGIELPVSEQGLFMEQFTMAPESPRIIVEASGAGGSKEILREFAVKH